MSAKILTSTLKILILFLCILVTLNHGGWAQTVSASEIGQLTLRVQELEEQIRRLNARMEDLRHQLQKQSANMNEGGVVQENPADISLKKIQNPNASPDEAIEEKPGKITAEIVINQTIAHKQPLSIQARGKPISLGLSHNAGKLGVEISNPPTVSLRRNSKVDSSRISSLDNNPDEFYKAAFANMQRGDYPSAQEQFSIFLNRFPDSARAASAQHWIGESYFAQGLYREAADAFLKGYTDYPGDKKQADNLFKLGLSLERMGEKKAACGTFQEVLDKHPNAAQGLLNRTRSEMKNSECVQG